jgi:hypothetical protein
MAARYDPATVTALARAEGMRPQSPIVGRVADTGKIAIRPHRGRLPRVK